MSDLREYSYRQAVLDAIVQPPFEELRERARERRRRRTTLTGLALVLAVAGLATPVLTGRTAEKPAPEPDRAMSPVSGDFVDISHGVLLYTGPATSDNEKCRAAVRITVDGGRSWSRPRPAPCEVTSLDDSRFDVAPRIFMLDSGTLLLSGFTSSHISFDTGRTWSTHRIERADADSIPAHTKIWRKCGNTSDCRVPNQLHWYDPSTGNVVQLRTPPAVRRLTGEPVWAKDQSLWVSGLTREGDFIVAVSRDRGRSWRSEKLAMKLDPQHPGYNTVWVVTYDGQTGYAVHPRKGKSRLFRTTDGGATWQRLHPTMVDLSYPVTWHYPYLAADGTLLLTIPQAPQHWYGSVDQGRTFTPQSQLSPIDNVRMVSDGYVGRTRSSPTIFLSEDGLRWRKVSFP